MGPLYYWIYIAIIGAGFVIGWRRFWNQDSIRPVVVFLGLTCVSELLSLLLSKTWNSNLLVYHIYNPIQIVLWGIFFHRNLRTGWRRTVPVATVFLLVFAVVNSLFLQPVNVYPSNLMKIASVILLAWSFCLFWEFLDRPASEAIFLQSSFIICVALLWFNLVSYLFFELYNYYVTSTHLLRSVWRIHLFSNYTYYSLLLAAMFLKAEPSPHD